MPPSREKGRIHKISTRGIVQKDGGNAGDRAARRNFKTAERTRKMPVFTEKTGIVKVVAFLAVLQEEI